MGNEGSLPMDCAAFDADEIRRLGKRLVVVVVDAEAYSHCVVDAYGRRAETFLITTLFPHSFPHIITSSVTPAV